MKVVALIQRTGHVCARYRIEAFREDFAKLGVALEVIPLGRETLRRVRKLIQARYGDVVVLQRKLLPFWQLHLLRGVSRRLVYDFDDALFQRDPQCGKNPTSWRRELRFWSTVYAADSVVAGNRYLGDRAAAYVDAGRVHVVPTCVDPDQYATAEHRRVGSQVKLAWIGQRATVSQLVQAGSIWSALAVKLPAIELRMVSDTRCELPGIRTTLVPWSAATEASELAACDIGVSWLPHDGWSRGKCGLKVLQYMAAGLPVVANPFGVHPEMVVPGVTGLLASTPQTWAAAVSRLAADPSLRRRMGQAGRKLVQERYSTSRWGPYFAALTAKAVPRVRPHGDAKPHRPEYHPSSVTAQPDSVGAV